MVTESGQCPVHFFKYIFSESILFTRQVHLVVLFLTHRRYRDMTWYLVTLSPFHRLEIYSAKLEMQNTLDEEVSPKKSGEISLSIKC